MSVLLCLQPDLEAKVIASLASTREESLVVRRCVDVVEVVAAARARVGRLAIVETDRDGLSLSMLSELQSLLGLALVPSAAERAVIDSGVIEALREQGRVELLDPDHETIAARIRNAHESIRPAKPVSEKHGTDGKIVSVWGPRGSQGRTTLLRDAAALIDGCLVIDGDTFAPSLAQFMDVDETSAIIAAARAVERGKELDFEKLITKPSAQFGNISVVQGMNEAQRWKEVSRWAIDRVWRACRAIAPITLVDLAGGMDAQTERVDRSAVTRSALENSDVVVHVASASPVGLRRMIEHLDYLDGDDGREHVIALTGIRSTAIGSGPIAQIQALLDEVGQGDLRWFPIRDDRDRLDAVLLRGSSMTAAYPQCQYTKDVKKLVSHICRDKLEE